MVRLQMMFLPKNLESLDKEQFFWPLGSPKPIPDCGLRKMNTSSHLIICLMLYRLHHKFPNEADGQGQDQNYDLWIQNSKIYCFTQWLNSELGRILNFVLYISFHIHKCSFLFTPNIPKITFKIYLKKIHDLWICPNCQCNYPNEFNWIGVTKSHSYQPIEIQLNILYMPSYCNIRC